MASFSPLRNKNGNPVIAGRDGFLQVGAGVLEVLPFAPIPAELKPASLDDLFALGYLQFFTPVAALAVEIDSQPAPAGLDATEAQQCHFTFAMEKNTL